MKLALGFCSCCQPALNYRRALAGSGKRPTVPIVALVLYELRDLQDLAQAFVLHDFP